MQARAILCFLCCVQFLDVISADEFKWIGSVTLEIDGRSVSKDAARCEPTSTAQTYATCYIWHSLSVNGFGGFPKLYCYDGYAYSSWRYVISTKIEYVCYKCPSCTYVTHKSDDSFDFQDSTRQICTARAECGAGKSGPCETECTDCPVGKAGPGATFWQRLFNIDFYHDAVCTDCVAGKYAAGAGWSSCADCAAGHTSGTAWGHCDPCAEGTKKTSGSTCTPCDAGQANPYKGQDSCWPCDIGKYAASAGSHNCASCVAGTYQDETGKTTCQECDTGSYQSKEGYTVCVQCSHGTYADTKGHPLCKKCVAGKSSDYGAITCTNCVAGKYSEEAGLCVLCNYNTKSGSGAAQCTACEAGKVSYPGAVKCDTCTTGQHINALFLTLQFQAGVSNSQTPCLWCAQCPVGTERALCLHNKTYPGVCMACEAGTRLVPDAGICEPCPANEFREINDVTRLQQTTCSMCPLYSTGPPGSNSLQNCECNDGFIRIYTTEILFICGCEFGRYIVNNVCQQCGDCIHGYYRSGCLGDNPGTCVKCDKQCSDDKQLAGCGGMHSGTCKKKTDLVRTPMCPVKQDYQQGLLSSAVGFGLYDFTSVFRASPHVLDFRCSDVCDGTTQYDTVECDGPYACNMATCAEDVSEEGNMIPVRACPVIITNEDDDSIILKKRGERCVACKDCGYNNYLLGSKKYNDWGAGCVRECSQLLCSAGMIWDWTARRCSSCEQLSDIRLCDKRDTDGMSLIHSTVTGNLPLLFFANCKAGGRNLFQIGYGKCMRCDYNQYSCSEQMFASHCENGANVKCKSCSRVTQSKYIDVLQGRWLNAALQQPLYCQISACKSRSGQQWTGVESSGKVCRRPCAQIKCTENERLVPCRLPHQARCEALFPARLSVPAIMHTDIFFVGGENNLLNEAYVDSNTDNNGVQERAVSSFENILIVLPSSLEYQCVWNADGIIDNTASPAGISHVFWPAGQTADELYNKRGTRACRVWDVAEDVEMPLLPLQNTIACSADENAVFKCTDRYVMVNTETYALSYSFSGVFGLVDSEPSNINMNFNNKNNLLRDEHVGNTGKLFLMLRMHQKSARLAINVPNDRALYNAQWLRALLVSYAVVDLTEYAVPNTQANIRVLPWISVHGQAINDAADSFIPEYFWSQPVSGADSHEDWEEQSSLFRVFSNGFAGQEACATDEKIQPIATIILSPWTPSLTDNYSWLYTKEDDASLEGLLLDVSMTCLFNNIASDCYDLLNSVDVYVLLQAYKPKTPAPSTSPTTQHYIKNSSDVCNAVMCLPTTDKTLLALHNIYRNIAGAPEANRVTAGNSAVVNFPLPDSSNVQINILQAHGYRAYSQCALLLTTSVVSTLFDTHQSILCVGGNGIHTMRSQMVAAKYSGAMMALVDEQPVLIFLMRSLNVFYTSLHWQNITQTTLTNINNTDSYRVSNSDTYASSWLSVTMIGNNITALYIDAETNNAAIGFYSLAWTLSSAELTLEEQRAAIILDDDFDVNLHNWQEYSRVVVSHDTENILVVAIESDTSDEFLETALLLQVCVCTPTKGSICSKIRLKEIMVSYNPNFLSVAFLQKTAYEEIWVVSVSGKVHEVIVTDNSISLSRLFNTDLEAKHFEKVDHLFYCFMINEVGNAVQPSIMTYLPQFKKWRTNTYATLPAVYAVLLVSLGESQNASDTSFVLDQDSQESMQMQEPMVENNISSVLQLPASKKTILVQKVLQLELRWANYFVPTPGSTAKPLYERTDKASGDEMTQLIVSPHTINARAPYARALLASYAVTTNNLTLNRNFGIPHAYGRYEKVANRCIFQHYRTGQGKQLIPSQSIECMEDIDIALTISGAICESTSTIDGVYTYYESSDFTNITLGKSVYARRTSLHSSILSSESRFLYYYKNLGWVISNKIGNTFTDTCLTKYNNLAWSELPAECGNILAVLPQNYNWTTQSLPVIAQEICKNNKATYDALNNTKLAITLTPKCCSAGQHMVSDVCTLCAAGKYSEAGWNTCTKCEAGKYSAATGSSYCTTCEAGLHSVNFGSQNCIPCPTASLCGVALQKPAIALYYAQETLLANWLHLLFKVPCNVHFQLFASPTLDCSFSDTMADDTICAQNSSVLVTLHATGSSPSKIFFLENDVLQTKVILNGKCIFMQLGVMWIDAALHNNELTEREIKMLLTRPASETSQFSSHDGNAFTSNNLFVAPLPPPGLWRRERHVLSLTSRRDMFVELFITRETVDSRVKVSMGIDDVQLTPVLSNYPPTLQNNKLCTLLNIPHADNLATIGLAHILRGNHSISHDNWERLDITVSLNLLTKLADGTSCTFTASLFYAAPDGSCSEDSTQLPYEHSLHRLGCMLTMKSQHVVGSYAECQVAVPSFLNSDMQIGIFVRADNADNTDNADNAGMTDNTTCALTHNDNLVVYLRPYTQLFSCPPGQFLDLTGTCVSCHRKEQICPIGSRLRGCPILEPASPENCILCTEGREMVNEGAAYYTTHDSEPCHWNCSEGYFLFQMLNERSCHKCNPPPESGCDAGFIWQECSFSQNSACVPCPDLRLKSGPYAANEQFLQNVNKSNTCQTECKAGAYKSYDGLCKQCWSRDLILLHEESGFFYFLPCTANSNAFALPCVAKPGELVLASDPGEGTETNPFTGKCVTECLPGWYMRDGVCKKCWPPLEIVQAKLTGVELPEHAYMWTKNTSSPCTFECKLPYTRTPAGAAVQTCVLCKDVCKAGEYPSGPFCKCDSCLM